MPGDVEEKGEDRFEGDDERAEAWVSIVVDIVAELEDVLDVADGYGADADEEETKGGASFREDMAALESLAVESFDRAGDGYTLEQSKLHDEFRSLVEGRVEKLLVERRFTPSSFVGRLKEVEELPGWSWARDTTHEVVALLRQVDSFQAWARAIEAKVDRRRHK